MPWLYAIAFSMSAISRRLLSKQPTIQCVRRSLHREPLVHSHGEIWRNSTTCQGINAPSSSM